MFLLFVCCCCVFFCVFFLFVFFFFFFFFFFFLGGGGGGPTRSDTNRTVQKIATGLEFLIDCTEICSESIGVDQLCGYCTADLRLCFRISKRQVFS